MNKFKKTILSLLLPLSLAVAISRPAQADVEYWQAFDTRIPLSDHHDLLPDQLHVFTIAQLATRYPGLGLLRFGVGPIWDINDVLTLRLSADLFQLYVPKVGYTPEYRIDIEPTLRGNWGALGWSDRNRLELRMRADNTTWRYRNQLRLVWNGWEGPVRPYAFNEAFLETGAGFNQNRTVLGASFLMGSGTRLDVGYMWRWRREGGTWFNDHILMLFMFFAPKIDPLISDPGSF
jgi:hypothetical protein